MAKRQREIIAVRSLTGSDLGIFAAHRDAATSKQRAININTRVAARLISASAFKSGGLMLDCFCTFRDTEDRSSRHLGKVHKNWRLGGNKLEGKEFAVIDNLDFVLIRSFEANNGSAPVSIAFVSRSNQPAMHSRIAKMIASRLKQSMAVFEEGDEEFRMLSSLCPLAPEAPTNGAAKAD
ncbi:hypothetical protein ABIF69_005851 [Bradyrhizobium japonicum]